VAGENGGTALASHGRGGQHDGEILT
jgi:hypothetical protein